MTNAELAGTILHDLQALQAKHAALLETVRILRQARDTVIAEQEALVAALRALEAEMRVDESEWGEAWHRDGTYWADTLAALLKEHGA